VLSEVMIFLRHVQTDPPLETLIRGFCRFFQPRLSLPGAQNAPGWGTLGSAIPAGSGTLGWVNGVEL